MAKRRGLGGYRGELAEPIRLSDPHRGQRHFSPRGPFLLTGAAKRDEAAEIERAILSRLPALFAHFGISEEAPDCWRLLALALARQHVPGLNAVRVTGAPVKISIELLCRLYRHFVRAKAERKQRKSAHAPNDADVCRALAKDAEFKRAFPELESASAKRLQNLIADAKAMRRARVADMMRAFGVRRSHSPDGWLWCGRPDWISDRPVRWRFSDPQGTKVPSKTSPRFPGIG